MLKTQYHNFNNFSIFLFQPHLPLTSSTSASSAGGLTTPTSPRPSATNMSGLPGTAGAIVVGYRGTFAFGRDGMADVCFRKLTRILVHGKVTFASCITYSTFNYRTRNTNWYFYNVKYFVDLEQGFASFWNV